MKKTFLVFVMMSIMLTSCETIVTPSATATPLPTPTAIVPPWKDSQVIDSSSQVVYSNETNGYQLEEIFGSGIALDSDTRWTIDVQVDNLVQDVGEAATAIILQGFTKSGILQNFIIAYQKGNWKILYQPDYDYPNYSYQNTFENLTNPIQHFELSISADSKSISLINDVGFEFHHSMQEEFFNGAEVIMVNAQIGPQTEITLSKLIVSQLQKDEIVNSPTTTSNLTPVPENIADAKDLSRWIDEYVYAYDGKVTVNGTEMNSSQLTDEIRKNGGEFIVAKQVNGIEHLFLVLNGVPLAIKEGNGQWQEATMKILGTLVNLKIGSLISNDRKLNTWWGTEYHIGFITLGLGEAMPNKTTIDFGWPNYQTQIATGNGMETMFEAVFFPADPPLWAKNGFTQDDLDNITRMVVENAKKHHIDEIVVVNEARIPADWATPDIYWEKFGIEYVIQAFRIAREIYPEAMLIYDDAANHLPGTFATETTLLISNTLFQEGLIDYVGVQMHVDQDRIPSKDELIKVFRNYPVPVVITSFDALLTNVPENERNEKMNEITKIVFDGCLESQVCINITTWGENDSVGWEGRTLLRDMDNNRKQAYYVAVQSMFEHLP